MTGIEAIEENLRLTLAMFARPNPSGETRTLPGVAVACSAMQFSMFNSAILTSPVADFADLEQRILTAGEFFAVRGFSWSFWVCQGRLDPGVSSRVAEVFARNRMHLVAELPAMDTECVAPPRRPLPRLEFRRVQDAVTRADFNRIMSIAFGIPFPISRAVYECERTWTGAFTGWVGYLDDLPVTSAATLISSDLAGVYAVGTLPTHQRKGYAEAAVRYALEEVRRATGIRRTILQSSEAGYALYHRMGYRTITRYAVFASN